MAHNDINEPGWTIQSRTETRRTSRLVFWVERLESRWGGGTICSAPYCGGWAAGDVLYPLRCIHTVHREALTATSTTLH